LRRVLIATSCNWTGPALLPAMLGPAGFTVDLLDPGRTQAAASRWVSFRTAVGPDMGLLVETLLRVAPEYERVFVCDEPLLTAVMESGDDRAADVLPAPIDALAVLLDKTRFPSVAREAGLRVPRSGVAASAEDLTAILATIGVPAILKGAHGCGGMAVRMVSDADRALIAAETLGYPVLVEEAVAGDSCLMPCLFERGALVAAIAAKRLRTVRPLGPSTVNQLRAVTPAMVETAQKAGAAFGLHGFASIDYLDTGDGSGPVVIEINPRAVPQLHLGARVGADMALALRERVDGMPEGPPRAGRSGGRVPLFPQELHRLVASRGRALGTLRWLATPGALSDVPWNDWPLVRRNLRRSG
jgi:hypothetical protein